MNIKVHESKNEAGAIQFFDHGLSDKRFLPIAKRKLANLIGLPISDVYFNEDEGSSPNRIIFLIPLKDIWGLSKDVPEWQTSITDYDGPDETNPTIDALKKIFDDKLSNEKTKSFFAGKDYDCDFGFDYTGALAVDYFTDAIADDPDDNNNAIIVDPDANMQTELRNMADAAKFAIGQIKDSASEVEATL